MEQSDSTLFSQSIRMRLRPISRVIVWNGTAVAGWMWTPIIAYRRLKGKDVKSMPGSMISLPRSARVLWILLPEGRFHRALEHVIPIKRWRYILYSDVPPDAIPFEVEGFRFVPDR